MNKLDYISLIISLLLLATIAFALHKYGGWRNLWAKINNRGIEKTYFHRKNLFEMLPPKDGAIVMLGNSSMYVVSVVLPAVQTEFGISRADAGCGEESSEGSQLYQQVFHT